MGNAFCFNVFGIGLREFVPSEDITGQDKTALDILIKFMTKEQIDQLWTIYCEIDVDQSGSIRDDEFRAFFSMEKDPFNQKLFSCFDADDSGYLNFFEFTCAVSRAGSVSVNYSCILCLMSICLCCLCAAVELPIH